MRPHAGPAPMPALAAVSSEHCCRFKRARPAAARPRATHSSKRSKASAHISSACQGLHGHGLRPCGPAPAARRVRTVRAAPPAPGAQDAAARRARTPCPMFAPAPHHVDEVREHDGRLERERADSAARLLHGRRGLLPLWCLLNDALHVGGRHLHDAEFPLSQLAEECAAPDGGATTIEGRLFKHQIRPDSWGRWVLVGVAGRLAMPVVAGESAETRCGSGAVAGSQRVSAALAGLYAAPGRKMPLEVRHLGRYGAAQGGSGQRASPAARGVAVRAWRSTRRLTRTSGPGCCLHLTW